MEQMTAQYKSSEQHIFRPSLPVSKPNSLRGILFVTVLLCLLLYWILIPIWPNLTTHILGDPETDAIRGMWGFDHIQRSLIPPNTPIWSFELNFHAGVIALMLPWSTGLILSPIGMLFGPIIGWNIGVFLMFLGFGLSTAWLSKTLTGSWPAGALAGALAMSQPMLLYAMADGTPEHISLWGMPIFLAFAIIALEKNKSRHAIFAGLMAIIIAFDSPYLVIYTLAIGAFVLPPAIYRGWKQGFRTEFIWTLGSFIAVILFGAIILISIYQFLPYETSDQAAQIELWKMNAADLRTWWQYEFQTTSSRQTGLAPTTIPFMILWGCLAFTLIGAPRSLPWLFGGILMLFLAMGYNPRLPVHLSHWIGPSGVAMGAFILEINEKLYSLPGLGEIRFPQRWMVPSAFMFLIGSSYGVARFYHWKRIRPFAFGLSSILAAGGVFLCVKSSQIDILFPMQHLPKIEFAEWIAAQPGSGAVITLPQSRPRAASGKRADMDVFANLNEDLSSSDVQYFQSIHGRPIYGSFSLKTLYVRDGNKNIDLLVRNWDDLALPEISGKDIPSSAYDPRKKGQRQNALTDFIQAGLRWVVVDEAKYNDEAMLILREQIGDRLKDEHHFDEGDGVLIFEVH